MLLQIKRIFYLSGDAPGSQVSLPHQDDTANGYINDVTDEGSIQSPGIQYIGFKLHKEEFLLPMSLVREIIMLTTITFVPSAKFLMEGIIALRGEIMPVLNLRRFLKFVRGKADSTTRVIILHCDFGGFGIIVDDITEFVRLQPTEVESIPQNFFPAEYRILSGVSRVGDRIRGIINLEKIVSEMTIGLKEESANGEEEAPSDH
ncbi:chemotaxis protein CheW [Spirobacillus cienkowskii]|uniref:chemotaxis protein CheW n=1 Tax=Spirobacillus cienkowskii TaxID=495820 RepID=UPI0030CE3521